MSASNSWDLSLSYECSSSEKDKKRSIWFFETIVDDDSRKLNVEYKEKCKLRQFHEWLKVRAVKRKMSISHAYVYFRNETQNIVPLSAIQNFSPKKRETSIKQRNIKCGWKMGRMVKRMFFYMLIFYFWAVSNLIFILFYLI